MSGEMPAPCSIRALCHSRAEAACPYGGKQKAIRVNHQIAFRSAPRFPLARRSIGGDGGNRTRVRNIRPETSTSLVDLQEIRRRAPDQHGALLRLADSLRQRYRRSAAAAHSV